MPKIKSLDPQELPIDLGAEYSQIVMACQEKMLPLRPGAETQGTPTIPVYFVYHR